MDNYLGEIRIFPYSRIPSGWLPCNGQELTVNGNQALYALLGQKYGGNGTTTFRLPNLNGRTIVGYGASARGPVFQLAQFGGTEKVALTDPTTIPPHMHLMYGSNTYNIGGANNNYLGNPNVPASSTQAAKNTAQVNLYVPPGAATVDFPDVVVSTGAANPHENRMPYLVSNYCIATLGTFPPRNN
ncbi:phage tail protein [Chitinophaga sancti]|uniref:Microcystin-dependent protein n=1 Tax=Chitinophaga sancti TaxID=1004 RepID=A0A1K1SM46_9BACT|nr:tail fiber protein [Chitinophaga sancti]WQD63917.1 tail fiber protein [Chitinophaga sancti]WQG90458.1 tail fiber protein [Chitinophaga sancti]SFW85403.1 Microcystin-dependent protein [Chitinophaga sancti]